MVTCSLWNKDWLRNIVVLCTLNNISRSDFYKYFAALPLFKSAEHFNICRFMIPAHYKVQSTAIFVE
jgi:hypothetical protein